MFAITRASHLYYCCLRLSNSDNVPRSHYVQLKLWRLLRLNFEFLTYKLEVKLINEFEEENVFEGLTHPFCKLLFNTEITVIENKK